MASLGYDEEKPFETETLKRNLLRRADKHPAFCVCPGKISCVLLNFGLTFSGFLSFHDLN